METDNSPSPAGRTALSNKTLFVIAASVAVLIFLITGLNFEAMVGTAFVGLVSAIVYKSIYRAEAQAESEAVHVIDRHRNPGSYSSSEHSPSTDVLEEIDLELMTLLDSAFEDKEVEKIERKTSLFDPTFDMSWKNIVHYLIKGKQIKKQ